ncbi:MAG: hypothetical protein KDA89_01670, partial [Planctomycetaceae bacterium]|nr:hypothetical protein [Planctomycetaceae bacterium]
MPRTIPPQVLLERARHALATAEYQEAERLSGQIPPDAPESDQALLIAGEAAYALNRTDQALEYYGRITADCRLEFLTAQRSVVTITMETGRLTTAENHLRNIRECVPDDPYASRRLARLLRLEGRRWESRPLLFELLRAGQF